MNEEPTAWDFGSDFNLAPRDVRRQESAEVTCSSEGEVLGFRVARDAVSSTRVPAYRFRVGSAFRFNIASAGKSRAVCDAPGSANSVSGFRLVHQPVDAPPFTDVTALGSDYMWRDPHARKLVASQELCSTEDADIGFRLARGTA